MKLLVLGLNHKTAPLEVRERLTFGPDIVAGALRDLTSQEGVDEAVVLSTCNRTELYCALADGSEERVRHWLSRFHGLEHELINPFLYAHADRDAISHLLRVASGLDSMVLGEPQILGQVKGAFHTASDCTATGKLLCRLFQHAFSVAKTVRTDTAIGSSPVSVAFAAVSLARQIFSDLSRQTALLIGAGETIELAARHLHQNGVGRIVVANRTVERAHEVAANFGGYAISLTEIATHLPEADIIIASTASPLPVLGKGAVERALKARKHRPMFMVDIAVPRDIEPEVAQLEDVYLFTVDDLQSVVNENMENRRQAAREADQMIATEVDRFEMRLRTRSAAHTIRRLREEAERTRQHTLDQARRMLAAGRSSEEVLDFLSATLTNRLIHAPSQRLRDAAESGDSEIIETIADIYHLDRD